MMMMPGYWAQTLWRYMSEIRIVDATSRIK
jgi:hypothetical protein